MQRMKLLIVCGKQSVCDSLAALMEKQGGFHVIKQTEILSNIDHTRQIQPDVVLYVYYGDGGGISDIKKLKETCPYTIVIVISDISDSSSIKAAFTAGADSYLTTGILPSDLVAAIELACRSEVCFLPRMIKKTILNLRTAAQKPDNNGESDLQI